jgi:hypothetical protein
MTSAALRVWLPRRLLDAALDELRTWGEIDRESIVLLLGRQSPGSPTIRTAVLPEPPGVHRGAGFVRLSERWMLRLTEWCEQMGETVLAQMHAHPLGNEHSTIDDHHLVHAPGILSIVVPDYARTSADRAPEAWSTYVGVHGGSFVRAQLTTTFEPSGVGRIRLLSEKGWRDAPA